jgi:murein DD-endopeptidase MepM/ murein hydrolase activator NlpD
MPDDHRRIARALLCSLLALLFALLPALTPIVGARPIELDTADDVALPPAGLLPVAPPPRTAIVTYRVQPGDSLWSIAADFDLDVDTLRWSNPEIAQNPDLLRLGQELVILPVRGAYVTVQPGDTVARLAERWGVAPADIRSYPLNALREGEEPRPGSKLVIPHGRRAIAPAPPAPAAGYTYAWPIRGVVTQRYWAEHRAVDLGAPYGAKVYAARAGRCISASWSEIGYGYLVIVDHGDGSRAYYSHLKGAWVQPGDWVGRGDLVGEVGSTGNSTGPHVHFEIRIGGAPQNPLDFLPPAP